jgi:outer membrane protein assembly factor BamA
MKSIYLLKNNFVLVFLLYFANLQAQNSLIKPALTDSLGVNAECRDSSRKPMFKALPLAFYTPETRLAGEGVAYYTFYTANSRRRSNVRFFATYTQNRQFFVILPWQIYTKSEQMFINGSLEYRLYPEFYYGLGNNTQEAARHLYTYKAFTFNNKLLQNIGQHTFVGLAMQYQTLETMLPTYSNEQMRTCHNVGTNGYNYIAAGPSLMYDTRDHILCPQRGNYLELTTLFAAGNADNMPINFAQVGFDYRNYTPIGKNATFANQFVAQFSVGNVPYRALPALGGAYWLRGYYAGRFRDKNLLLYQTEYRQHLWGRFGVVAFAAAGRVFETFNPDIVNNIHTSAGLGLRLRISKNEQTNIRLDYSITKDSHGFYVYFAEAF